MRCYICDQDSETVNLDAKTKQFTPCSECQSIIYECVISYEPDDDIELEPVTEVANITQSEANHIVREYLVVHDVGC